MYLLLLTKENVSFVIITAPASMLASFLITSAIQFAYYPNLSDTIKNNVAPVFISLARYSEARGAQRRSGYDVLYAVNSPKFNMIPKPRMAKATIH
jgi:hypothetical protein